MRSSSRPGPATTIRSRTCSLPEPIPWSESSRGRRCKYESRGWDFGWLMARTDGYVARLLLNPYTLKFERSQGHYPIRWFVR